MSSSKSSFSFSKALASAERVVDTVLEDLVLVVSEETIDGFVDEADFDDDLEVAVDSTCVVVFVAVVDALSEDGETLGNVVSTEEVLASAEIDVGVVDVSVITVWLTGSTVVLMALGVVVALLNCVVVSIFRVVSFKKILVDILVDTVAFIDVDPVTVVYAGVIPADVTFTVAFVGFNTVMLVVKSVVAIADVASLE